MRWPRREWSGKALPEVIAEQRHRSQGEPTVLWRKSGPGRGRSRIAFSMVGWLGWSRRMERRKGVRAERTGACWPLAGLVFMPVRWALLGVSS